MDVVVDDAHREWTSYPTRVVPTIYVNRLTFIPGWEWVERTLANESGISQRRARVAGFSPGYDWPTAARGLCASKVFTDMPSFAGAELLPMQWDGVVDRFPHPDEMYISFSAPVRSADGNQVLFWAEDGFQDKGSTVMTNLYLGTRVDDGWAVDLLDGAMSCCR